VYPAIQILTPPRIGGFPCVRIRSLHVLGSVRWSVCEMCGRRAVARSVRPPPSRGLRSGAPRVCRLCGFEVPRGTAPWRDRVRRGTSRGGGSAPCEPHIAPDRLPRRWPSNEHVQQRRHRSGSRRVAPTSWEAGACGAGVARRSDRCRITSLPRGDCTTIWLALGGAVAPGVSVGARPDR